MQNLEFNVGAIKPIECAKEAWELVKTDYWMLFAISLLGGLIGGASMYVLLGPMVCGIFYTYLKKIDVGGKVSIDDLWVGMKYFMPSLLVTIVFVVPMVVWIVVLFVTIYLPLIATAMMGNNPDPSVILGTFAVGIVIDIIVAVIMTIVHSLIIFAFPLIVDRNLSSWDAMKLSARAAMKNMGGIAGLIGVNFCLVLIGYLALCIGLYLMIPIITATSVIAYRKVFPALNAPNFDLPPAVTYQGLS
ncbi:MAG: hypothetical protein IPK01_12520 [Acidobacteria bacterium]|nr:hypothetical protein [Acidobacteriota bacterium]